jgi:hypothetical protein
MREKRLVQHGDGTVETSDLSAISPKLHSVVESSIVRSATMQRLTKKQQAEVRPCVRYSNNKYCIEV